MSLFYISRTPHLQDGLAFVRVGMYSSVGEHETQKLPPSTLKTHFLGFNLMLYFLSGQKLLLNPPSRLSDLTTLSSRLKKRSGIFVNNCNFSKIDLAKPSLKLHTQSQFYKRTIGGFFFHLHSLVLIPHSCMFLSSPVHLSCASSSPLAIVPFSSHPFLSLRDNRLN